VRAAALAFRALVALWPAQLTRRHRAEAVDLFTALAADAYTEGGWRRLAWAWLCSVADLVSFGSRRITAAAPRLAAGAALSPARPHRLDDLGQDLRYARRSFGRTPGFTAAAVLLLALGIGASTAIFSVLQAVVLGPLPYPEPDRLMAVWSTLEGERMFQPLSAPDYYDWRERNRSFEELGVHTLDWVNGSGTGRPERVRASICTASFLRALGVAPARGRLFTDDEEKSRVRVAVIGDGLRKRWFGGNLDVIGRQIVVNREPHTLIGSMPPGFESPRPSHTDAGAEIWLPLAPEPRVRATGTWYRLHALGRLASGVSMEKAGQDLAVIAADLAREHPDTNARITAWVQPLVDQMVGDVRRPLWFLLAAVVVLLTIACANVAGMLLARGSARRRELVVRASLGASQGRLARQAITESLVLAVARGRREAAGILLAWLSTGALREVVPPTIQRASSIRIDRWVLLFSTGAAMATGIVCGVTQALSATRLDINGTLRLGPAALTPGPRRARFRHALLVAQLALALALAHGAVLMLRSYLNVLGTPPGVDTAHTLVAAFTLQGVPYDGNEAAQSAFCRRLAAEVTTIPGVSAAGVTTKLPFQGGTNGAVLVAGEEYDPDARRPVVEKSYVSPLYFAAVGLPLVAGHPLAPARPGDTVFELVVNQAFVERYWPGANPLGRVVRSNSREPTWSGVVVGVVGDARQWGLEQPPLPEIYYPADASSRPTRYLVARTTVPPLTLARAVSEVVSSMDPDLPVAGIRTMGDVFAAGASSRRFQTMLVQMFALTALLMVLAGLYAVTSYHVAGRTREIGIRIALGAERTEVVTAVVGRSLSLAALGASIGVGVALASSRVTAGLLYGVGPGDLTALLVVAMVAIVVAAAGSTVPALRAASVDPTVALRDP